MHTKERATISSHFDAIILNNGLRSLSLHAINIQLFENRVTKSKKFADKTSCSVSQIEV